MFLTWFRNVTEQYKILSDTFFCIFLYEDDLKPQATDCDDVNQHSFTCWDVAMQLGPTGDSDPSFLSIAEKEES